MTEKSCGAVVFTKDNGRIEFLIVRSKDGYFGFPKGHMEGGETEKETALREIKEETGLTVRLIDGFRTEDSHSLAREGRPDVIKHNVYFLAEFTAQTPAAQEAELSSIHLMDYETAMNVLQLESFRLILCEANCRLNATL